MPQQLCTMPGNQMHRPSHQPTRSWHVLQTPFQRQLLGNLLVSIRAPVLQHLCPLEKVPHPEQPRVLSDLSSPCQSADHVLAPYPDDTNRVRSSLAIPQPPHAGIKSSFHHNNQAGCQGSSKFPRHIQPTRRKHKSISI